MTTLTRAVYQLDRSAPTPLPNFLRSAKRARGLLSHLLVHGRPKYIFSGELYAMVTRDLALPPYAVDQAIDDLWRTGLIDVRIVGRCIPVVTLCLEAPR